MDTCELESEHLVVTTKDALRPLKIATQEADHDPHG